MHHPATWQAKPGPIDMLIVTAVIWLAEGFIQTGTPGGLTLNWRAMIYDQAAHCAQATKDQTIVRKVQILALMANGAELPSEAASMQPKTAAKNTNTQLMIEKASTTLISVGMFMLGRLNVGATVVVGEADIVGGVGEEVLFACSTRPEAGAEVTALVGAATGVCVVVGVTAGCNDALGGEEGTLVGATKGPGTLLQSPKPLGPDQYSYTAVLLYEQAAAALLTPFQ